MLAETIRKLFDIESYATVHHMVSTVRGQLQAGHGAVDLLRGCFPGGSITGAPKIRAMEIIAELEPDQRGPYAGAVGYVGYGGNLDTAITIRTIVAADTTAYIQAGAGIVADSVPANEYQESMNKAMALLRAIEVAERGL